MLQSRRGFLIGAGSLLTTAFVSEATAFVRTTGKPLLFTPPDPNYWLFWNDFYRGSSSDQPSDTNCRRSRAGENFSLI